MCKVFGDKAPEERNKIIVHNKMCPFCLLYNADEVCYTNIFNSIPACLVLGCNKQHIQWLHSILLSGGNGGKVVGKGSMNVVRECGGWRMPDESWMNMEDAGDEDMYFGNMVATEQEEGKSDEDDASLARG
jgi:hypothetical protein